MVVMMLMTISILAIRDDFPSRGRDDPPCQIPMGQAKYDDRVKTSYTHGRDDFPSQGRDNPAPMGQPKYDGHVWCGYGRDDFPSQGRDDPASQVPMVRLKYDDRVYLSHTDRRDDFPSRGRDDPTSQFREGPASQVPLGQPGCLSYRQPIDPETYDGKTSVEEYLKRFEQIADWNKWDDEEAAIQLSLKLKGSAKRIVKILPENQR